MTTESKNLIDKTKYYLGSFTKIDDYYNSNSKSYYNLERGNSVYTKNPTSWTGYIGLMYASDYGYATSGGDNITQKDCLNKKLYNETSNNKNDAYYNINNCQKNNWLLDINNIQWAINPDSLSHEHNSRILNYGLVGQTHNYTAYNIKPVLYLKSTVLITSGKGTKENPFHISL